MPLLGPRRILTIDIRHRRRLRPTNPLPPIRQQTLFQKPKEPPHHRQRFRPLRYDIALLPAAPSIILSILLELRIRNQGHFRGNQLRSARKDPAVDRPLLEELLKGPFGGRGGAERAGREAGFQFLEDEARVAVDIAADGENGDASVLDPYGDVRLGRGLDSMDEGMGARGGLTRGH